MAEPTVYQALLSAARADDLLSKACGGRVLDHVPEVVREKGHSAVVLVHAGNTEPEQALGGDRYTEAGRFEWHCYDRGSRGAELLALRVQELFDPAFDETGAEVPPDLDLDPGWDLTSWHRVGYLIAPETPWADGQKLFRAVVPYEGTVARPVPTRAAARTALNG